MDARNCAHMGGQECSPIFKLDMERRMITAIKYAIVKHQVRKQLRTLARKEAALGCNTQAVHKCRTDQYNRTHDALRAVVARDKAVV